MLNLFFARQTVFFRLCLFISTLLFSCGKANVVPERNVPRVKIAVVEEQTPGEELSGFGSISFLTKLDVAASQDGVIRRIHYREGAIVPKGAVIAELDNPQIDLAVGRAENARTQAEAALKLSQARLLEGEFNAEAEILNIEKALAELAVSQNKFDEQQRKADDQEKLYTAGGLSDEAIRETRFGLASAGEELRLMEMDMEIRTVGLRDEDLQRTGLFPAGGFASETEHRTALVRLATSTLRAETEAAEAQLEAAVKELESVRIAKAELTLYCPSAGIVGARYLEESERIKKEDKILTLMDTDSLYVIFPLRESDALRLRKGMAARVTVDSADDVYDGIVDLVSPQADSQSFTFSVRVLLPQNIIAGTDKLRPGMFARVTILLDDGRAALTVPESAVIDRKENEGCVFVVNGGNISRRNVSPGKQYGGNLEIFSGLKAGEIIVLKPDASLKEGLHVIPE